jgi:hypothetical protein
MIPHDIGPDPTAGPGHYRVFKGPPSMADDCGDITCRINKVEAVYDDPPSARFTAHYGENGPYLGFCVEWVPTDRERDLIAAGQPIRLNMVGGLTPHMLWAREVDEV